MGVATQRLALLLAAAVTGLHRMKEAAEVPHTAIAMDPRLMIEGTVHPLTVAMPPPREATTDLSPRCARSRSGVAPSFALFAASVVIREPSM